MNFVISMTAFGFTGILDKIAIELGVSVADAGLFNSLYSYGAAFGAPAALLLFRRVKRTGLLRAMLLISILMTLIFVLAKNFTIMLMIRFVMGVATNSFSVLAVSTVMAVSPKDKQGRYMAYMIMGNSLALVIGIPLTRALSSVLDWRGIFWILNAIMIVSLICLKIYLTDETDDGEEELDIKNEMSFFKNGKILLIIIYALVMFIGYGAFYNYITPYLLVLFPSLDKIMSIILVLLGIASFLGNMIGGFTADKIGYARSLLLGALLQAALAGLIILFQPYMWICVPLVILWLMSTWFAGLQINTSIAQVTKNKSSFMISVNRSMIQLGTAIGSSLAAVVISKSEIQNIVFITLAASIAITLVQIISIKNTP